MKRALLLSVLLLSACAHGKPQTPADAPSQSEWVLSTEAKDSDQICSQTWDDGPYKHCKLVGEVRAFLRTASAEP